MTDETTVVAICGAVAAVATAATAWFRRRRRHAPGHEPRDPRTELSGRDAQDVLAPESTVAQALAESARSQAAVLQALVESARSQAELAIRVDAIGRVVETNSEVTRRSSEASRRDLTAAVSRLETIVAEAQSLATCLLSTAEVLQRDARLDDTQRTRLAKVRNKIARGLASRDSTRDVRAKTHDDDER